MDRGAWWATVHGVTKSQTQLSDQVQHTAQVENAGFSAFSQRSFHDALLVRTF